MNRLIICAITLTLGFLAHNASAQVCMSLDVTNPGFMERGYLPSSAYPIGGPDNVGPFPLVSAAFLPPAGFPAGGMTCNQISSTIYTTDGFLMAMDLNPIYPPLTGTPLPPPTPLAPIFFPAPAPGLGGFGPVTGLAIDAAAGILYVCDPFSFCPYPIVPPFIPLAPAAALIPGAAIGGPPITGIGFESSTGSLWACDAGGFIFNFTPGGLPIGPQPVAIQPLPAGPLTGLAVNTSNGPGSFGIPACSPQILGHHIEVTDGVLIFDAIAPNPPIPLVFGPSGFGSYGLCYSNDFQITLGAAPCSTGFFGSIPGMVQESYVGPGAFNGLTVYAGPPLATIRALVDLCVIPGGGVPLPGGDILHISPFTSSYVTGFALTDTFGKATIPVSMVPLPAGVQVSFQWAFPDPAGPFGVCLSDAVTFTTGLP